MDQSKYVPFDRFISIPNGFFKTIGLDAYSRTATQKTSIFSNCLFIFGYLNCVLVLCGEQIYAVKYGKYSFLETSFVVLCCGYIYLAFAKTITIAMNKQKMTKIMWELQRIYPKTMYEQEKYDVIKYVSEARRIMITFSTICMIMIWSFSFYGLAESYVAYLNTGIWKPEFSYKVWYPYDAYKTGGIFELSYISQTYAGHVTTSAIIGTDLLLCGTIMQLCMHFDGIGRKLSELKPKGKKFGAKEYRELAKCVKQHDLIISLTQELEDMFGFSNLINIISSSVIICLLGFLSATGLEPIQLFKYLFGLLSLTTQIFVVCWIGNRLIDSSSSITKGAYNSEWFSGDERYRKSLILLMLRSQKPQVLTAVKFAVISLATFNSILSRSYSYFALLRTIYAK